MFGAPSLSKLLILVVVVAAVWYGFKLIGQLDRARKEQARVAGKSRGRARQRGQEVEDMAKCPRCEAYVSARHALACSRPDCPYPAARRDAA